jgi:flagellar hook protein FlgE
MLGGMYAAISGLDVSQDMLDVTANNIANVNTIGYKSQRTTFADALTQMQRGASGPTTNNGGTNPVQIGLGVQLDSIDNQMQAGSYEQTSNPLDVAIQGDGFFRVAQGAPPVVPTSMFYTQAGNLTTNTAGFLTTQSGDYVIGKNAVPASPATTPQTYTPGATDSYIQLPAGASNISIGADGSVSYLDGDPTSSTYNQQVTGGYLSVATFPNQAGLERIGGSLWQTTANSGSEVVGTPNTPGFPATVGGQLEMSNVDLATEFTNMIVAERGYEANARVISTADTMLQNTTQLGQGG